MNDLTVHHSAHDAAADLLVVDDNPNNLDLLCNILRDRGYHVRVATSGARALAAARVACPDLVMLDINMPGMHGYDVCRELKRDATTRNAPVIFASALDEVIDKVRAFEAGGVDYVTKPFEVGEVLARIENQLKISRLTRELESRNAALEQMVEELRRAHGREAQMFRTIADILPGSELDGKYRLERVIGSGGFGTVFRATQLSLDRPVAVKIFRALAGTVEPGEIERFRREGMAACRVNHPNAVAIIDSGVSNGGIAYLVMELLDGWSFSAELAEEGRIGPARLAAVLAPVCDALAQTHALGIVHRDIKPENIFLHKAGGVETVKVLDFGIAKLLPNPTEAPAGLTAKHHLVGTLNYMAPERIAGAPYDGGADVFSLGVTAYQALAGELPWQSSGTNLISFATMHASATIRPLRELRPELSEELEATVMAALERDPARRPTAETFGRNLASAAAAHSEEDR
jgi:CheY-like chemotaxis protein